MVGAEAKEEEEEEEDPAAGSFNEASDGGAKTPQLFTARRYKNGHLPDDSELGKILQVMPNSDRF